MTDSWGDNVPVTEDEDWTFLSKATFLRVGHSLFHFANKVEGMDWSDVWQALTGDVVRIQSKAIPAIIGQHVDFVELFNPGSFTTKAYDLTPGLIIDMSVDPEKDMRVETYRAQAQHDIGKQDPMIVIGAPPCTVFSAMQNLNQKHHNTTEWKI